MYWMLTLLVLLWMRNVMMLMLLFPSMMIFLSKLLEKHAPLKEIDVVERQLNDWMTDDILALKKNRRKKELIWRKNPSTINFDIYIESCKAVKLAIENSKAELVKKKVTDCNGDQKKTVQNYRLTAWSQKATSFTRILLCT